MAIDVDDRNLAVFCDFENVALGVRDAKYAKFNIGHVLERLLLKGSIVVKKAYCDWERYKEFKAVMHEAAFELIEIPHVRQSGKNSADIRMVVDALDLCYTKAHVDTFVIVSGDSDFSPLVSKLRENNKTVIGVGVKNSAKKQTDADGEKGAKKEDAAPKEDVPQKDDAASKEDAPSVQEALDLVIETADALNAERGHGDKLWGSMIKQALRRRRPGFNERYYGFASFSDLLEEAQNRGLLELEADERSGGYTVRRIAEVD
jgi:uncharacterized protein (TIGR00288 family)